MSGSPSDPLKVLLIGQTGAGKTSIVNFLCSCSERGIPENVEDLFPLKSYGKGESLVGDGRSVTKEIHLYKLALKKDKKTIHVDLYDSPGLGDTEGYEQDERNMIAILTVFQRCQKINGLILMFNGAEGRLQNSRSKYILQMFYGVLPRTFTQSTIVIFSHTEHISVQQREYLKELEFSEDNLHFYDNLLYGNRAREIITKEEFKIKYKPKEMRRLNDSIEDGYETLFGIFEQIQTFTPRPSTDFKMIHENRIALKSLLESIIRNYADNLSILDNIQSNHFITDTKVLGVVSIEKTSYMNTTCKLCLTACHEDCALSELPNGSKIHSIFVTFVLNDHHTDFSACAAFNGQMYRCKHDSSLHFHYYAKFITQETVISSNPSKRAENERILTRFQESAKIEIEKYSKELSKLCPPCYDYRVELATSISMLRECIRAETSLEKQKSVQKMIEKLTKMNETFDKI